MAQPNRDGNVVDDDDDGWVALEGVVGELSL